MNIYDFQEDVHKTLYKKDSGKMKTNLKKFV